MNQPTKRSDSGFTIIEVVLVLAIAALIMLMVFLALPALQRGQRDTQRKDNISRLQSAISNYSSANRGNIPSDWGAFINTNMKRGGDTFADPSGEDYVIEDVTGSANPFNFDRALGGAANVDEMYRDSALASKIYIVRGGTCVFEGTPRIQGAATGSRKVAILKALEDGNYECRET